MVSSRSLGLVVQKGLKENTRGFELELSWLKVVIALRQVRSSLIDFWAERGGGRG